MAAGTSRIVIEQGAVYDAVFTYEDASGRPIDLTGWSAKMQFRRFVGGTLLLEASTANGRITLGGPAGTVIVHIPASVTSGVALSGVYDLDLIPPAGADGTIRLLSGPMRLSPAVTVA